ncbi:MAG: ABC transporter permease [Flexilinea flocculi]|jgi:ABC-type uncharacterized transport system permease subunit|nr:ABC transporter permease [Flexilinea flocculi]
MDNIFTATFFVSIFASTIRLATPILLTALGEIYTQRSGILNLGLEGTMTMSAMAGFVCAYFSKNLFIGFLGGIIVGMICSAFMAFLSITVRANQVIAGTALTILGIGFSSFIYRIIFGIQKLPPQVDSLTKFDIPLLSSIPYIGTIFFQHNLIVYLAYILAVISWIVLEKTTFGLNVKAVGEHPRAADSKGINVSKVRYTAVIIGGAFAGLSGAFMSIAYMNSFSDTMIAGRGFIAVAVVVFARWNPLRAMVGSLLFGIASALQIRFQAIGVPIPNQFLLMLPYLVTIIALITVSKKAEFPSAYTKPYSRMER